MARVITTNASNAFHNNKRFSGSNTMVTVDDTTVKLFLFGKHIATKTIANGNVSITNAGWPTVTTVDRLRGIGANVRLAGGKRGIHLSGTMYLNNVPMVNGQWYDIGINFEPITLRCEASHRGGGIEIDLSSLGYDGEKMTAYQNYLGGGILGRIGNSCTIDDWRNDPKLEDIADQLARYFHNITNHSDDEWESATFEQNQNRPSSAY